MPEQRRRACSPQSQQPAKPASSQRAERAASSRVKHGQQPAGPAASKASQQPAERTSRRVRILPTMRAMPTSAPSVGELEHLLLLAVLQCQRDGTDAYTVPIRQQLVERTGRAIARGAVHTSLDRLEHKGLVTSAMGEPVAIRGGRARRYYTVTALGLKAV